MGNSDLIDKFLKISHKSGEILGLFHVFSENLAFFDSFYEKIYLRIINIPCAMNTLP